MNGTERWLAVAILLLPAALAGGCGSGPAAMAVEHQGLTARLELEPPSPAALRPVAMNVWLRRADGSPVENARVTLRLRMPSMEHAPATVRLEARGKGRYEGVASFEMAGTWEVVLSVSADGTLTGRFGVTVTP